MLDATRFLALTDGVTAAYLKGVGTDGSDYGTGDSSLAAGDDWGVSSRLRTLQTEVVGWADVAVLLAMLEPMNAAINVVGGNSMQGQAFRPVFEAINRACREAGIANVFDLETFAAYYNIGLGGSWTALLHPRIVPLYRAVYAKTPNPYNVFALPIANMGSRAIAATVLQALVAGTDVDETLYAGASRPQVTISGLTFTGGTTTGTVTVTGRARQKTGGLLVDGRIFTAPFTANSTVNLTPDVANDMLVSVDNITFSAGITAITAQVLSQLPSGRANPPT